MASEIILKVLEIIQSFLNLNNSNVGEIKQAKRLNRIVKKRAKLFEFLAKQRRKEKISLEEYNELKDMLKETYSPTSQFMNYDVRVPQLQPQFTLSSAEYFEDWSFDFMEIDEIWKISKGENALIYIVDTGLPQHEHLQSNVRNDLGESLTDENIIFDMQGHQTHCTGLAVGKQIEGKKVGIAPDATCIPFKGLRHSGGAGYDTICAAIRLVVDKPMPEELKDKVKILSLSLSGTAYSKEIDEACQYAMDNGVIVCAAAGNSGTIGYPANINRVLAIGAIDEKGNPTYFTGKGENVDLALPGLAINSTYPTDVFAVHAGTSQACPKAVGFIACLVSALPDLRGHDNVANYLREHLTDIHIEGKDEATGYGTIKASKYAADILRRRAEKEVEELPEGKDEGQIAIIEAIRFLYPIDEIGNLSERQMIRIASLLNISGIQKEKYKKENATILIDNLYPQTELLDLSEN